MINTNFKSICSFIVMLVAATANAADETTSVFPSTGTAWLIPGYAEDSQALDMTKADVAAWEGVHADIAGGGFGRNEGYYPEGSTVETVGYMLNQVFGVTPEEKESGLKNMLGLDDEDGYESLFMHYKGDTPYDLSSLGASAPTLGSRTVMNGVPWVMGWTQSEKHSGYVIYQKPPFNVEPFPHYGNGGALYVYSFEKFYGIDITLPELQVIEKGKWQLQIEYISECEGEIDTVSTVHTTEDGTKYSKYYEDSTSFTYKRVSGWSTVNITLDETDEFTESGRIRWNVPTDWEFCTTGGKGFEETYGGSQWFAKKSFSYGQRAYAIRIKLVNVTVASNSELPILYDLKLPLYVRFNNGDPTKRVIPGWNPLNDVDGDGWVNDEEYANLVDPSCTARFKYESRAMPIGRFWSETNAFIRTNVFGDGNDVTAGDAKFDRIATAIGTYYKHHSRRTGQKGYYNDLIFSTVGPNLFRLDRDADTNNVLDQTKIGKVWEFVPNSADDDYDVAIDSEEFMNSYDVNWAHLLKRVKEVSEVDWLLAEISQESMFASDNRFAIYEALDGNVMEAVLSPWMGITGYTGIAKLWDIGVFAAANKHQIVQMNIRYSSRIGRMGKTKENWEADIYGGTALYYLLNEPNSTYYNCWGNNFHYGSGNTKEGFNWYESGIPRNIAYQPTSLLEVDIGIPAMEFDDFVPNAPLEIQQKIPGVTNYHRLGDSLSTEIKMPLVSTPGAVDGESNNGRIVGIKPTRIYWAQAGEYVAGAKQPADGVLARKYTKGLVLFRTDLFGNNLQAYLNTPPITIPLNATYQQIYVDGTLGPNITEISLGMYDGAILVKSGMYEPKLENVDLDTFETVVLTKDQQSTEISLLDYDEVKLIGKQRTTEGQQVVRKLYLRGGGGRGLSVTSSQPVS